MGLLPSVNLLFQMWGSPAFAAHWRLLRHMQDPQTHCTPHLDSESEWEMLRVGVSEALSHPTDTELRWQSWTWVPF